VDRGNFERNKRFNLKNYSRRIRTGYKRYRGGFFFACPRQLWFSSHQINMEDHSELVRIGKIIDKKSYLRKRKKIYIEPLQLDLIDSQKKIVGEIKKSRKIEKAHRFQLLYYLFC